MTKKERTCVLSPLHFFWNQDNATLLQPDMSLLLYAAFQNLLHNYVLKYLHPEFGSHGHHSVASWIPHRDSEHSVLWCMLWLREKPSLWSMQENIGKRICYDTNIKPGHNTESNLSLGRPLRSTRAWGKKSNTQAFVIGTLRQCGILGVFSQRQRRIFYTIPQSRSWDVSDHHLWCT